MTGKQKMKLIGKEKKNVEVKQNPASPAGQDGPNANAVTLPQGKRSRGVRDDYGDVWTDEGDSEVERRTTRSSVRICPGLTETYVAN